MATNGIVGVQTTPNHMSEETSQHSSEPIPGASKWSKNAYHRSTVVGVVAIVVLLAAIPVFTRSNLLFEIELILIYACSSMGANLTVGYAGELFLGQATVMAVSAYTAAILNVTYGWNPWLTLPLALVAGIAIQVILSLPGLR